MSELIYKILKYNEINENNNNFKAITETHISLFQKGLSTSLGKEYIDYFYKKILTEENNVLIGCFDRSGELLGFVAATRDADKFFDSEHKRFILKCLRKSLLKFNFPVENFLRALVKNYKFSKCKIEPELLSIIVFLGNKNKGIGSHLMKLLEDYYQQYKIKNWKVSTDAMEAYDFYKRKGLKIVCEFDFLKIKSALFVNERE